MEEQDRKELEEQIAGKEAAVAAELAAKEVPPAVAKKRGSLQSSLVEDAKAWLAAEKSGTAALKAFAAHVVAFRQTFIYKDMPDWAGKSAEYKGAVELVYKTAGISGDAGAKHRSALSYHIGNALRPAMAKFYTPPVGKDASAEQKQEALDKGTQIGQDRAEKLGISWKTPKEAADARRLAGQSPAGGAAVPGGRVQVPGVQVTPEVSALSVAVASGLAHGSALECARQALATLQTAKGFDIPETGEDRMILVMTLSTIAAEVESWAKVVASYVPPAGTEDAGSREPEAEEAEDALSAA